MNAAILLRQKILDLAIRGKLTKREKGDEPASFLLARIAAEKEKRNARVGRARTSAVPDPIAEDETPFDLPKGWIWCRLGELCESIQYGYNAPAKKQGRIRMVRITDIQDGRVIWSQVPYCDIKESEISGYLLKPGDILFARTGGTVGKSFLVSEVEGESIYAGYLIRTRYFSYLEERYFKYFMESSLYWEQLREGTIATAQPNCNGKTLSRMKIPLPPLAEQKRIVERIDELLAAVDQYSSAMNKISEAADMLEKKVLDLAIRGKLTKREKGDGSAAKIIDEIAADKAKRIAKKLMRKEKTLPPIMPEDEPFDLPKGWVWCRFGELCAYGQCEAVSFSGLPKNTWALDLEEIEKDTGRLIERKLVKDKQATSGKHLFKKGMLLYSKLRTYLNKVLIADQDGVCTSEIIPIDFYGFVDVAYARIVLMSPYFLSYTASKDYGVKMPRVSTDDMRMAVFPLPPLAEQKRIVERVDAILTECRKISR